MVTKNIHDLVCTNHFDRIANIDPNRMHKKYSTLYITTFVYY